MKKTGVCKSSAMITISLVSSFFLLTSCGKISQTLDQGATAQEKATSQDLTTLNQSLGKIQDEASATKAIVDLETYANKKTNLGIHIESLGGSSTFKTFSISDDLKTKLVKAELSLHKKGFHSSSLRASSVEDGTDNMSVADLIKVKEEESQQGLSAQDIADALNSAISSQGTTLATAAIKTANSINPFTSNDIEIIRDKTLQMLPSSGETGSDRMGPIEALIIGYMVASDDDGTQKDGEVTFLANQAQINNFATTITNKIQ